MAFTGLSIALGSLVGLLMALTGAGGGILAVPLLVFGLHLGVAQSAPIGLIAVGLSAALGAGLGLRDGIVRYRAASLIGGIGMLMAPLGVAAARRIPNAPLTIAFALVLAIAAWRMHQRATEALCARARPMSADTCATAGDPFATHRPHPHPHPSSHSHRDSHAHLHSHPQPPRPALAFVHAPTPTPTPVSARAGRPPGVAATATLPCVIDARDGRLVWTRPCVQALALTGVLSGVLSGLLGVGGGFVIVPALTRYTELPARSVVATSLAVIALVAVGSVGAAAARGGVAWPVALPFASGAMLALLIGRRIAARVAGPRLQQCFAVVSAGVSMLLLARGLGWITLRSA